MLDLPRRREMLAPARQFDDATNVWESNDTAVGETDALVAYLSGEPATCVYVRARGADTTALSIAMTMISNGASEKIV